MSIKIATEPRPKNDAGWRSGKPVEDPEKTKRWGFVTAKPSEYLVHVRGGAVRESSSGQGATCFKWPWDAVAIVPTSLQRLSFTADQVSVEKVGMEVVGLAVYRIADPLIAYRVLNFSFPERAQEKLEQTLTGMFVGAARRLMANLSVEECLKKRKGALADELIREVAPIVSGEGRPGDRTSKGWGVVVDTIEIQEVRVLSEKVFASMQAPYRVALDRAAREARAEADRATALREAADARQVEEAKLAARMALNERRAELEARDADMRAAGAVHAQELAVREAQAEIAAYAARAEATKRRAELARVEQAAELDRRRAEAEVALVEGKGRAEVLSATALAERARMEGEARLEVAKRLPDLAEAVGQKFGEVKVTQIGGEGNGLAGVAQAVAAVVEMVRSA